MTLAGGSPDREPVTVQQVGDASVVSAPASTVSTEATVLVSTVSSVDAAPATTTQDVPAQPTPPAEQPAPEPAPAPAPAPEQPAPSTWETTPLAQLPPAADPPPCWDHDDPATGQPVYVPCDEWGQ